MDEERINNENEEFIDNEDFQEDVIEQEEIKISNEVVAAIAGKAVSEVEGVYGMAGSIAEVFKGKKNLAKGIKVEVGEKETKIDVNIIVEYGVRIPDIAFQIQNRVKKAVEAMTGLTVSAVNIHVQGINTEENKEKKKYIIQIKISKISYLILME